MDNMEKMTKLNMLKPKWSGYIKNMAFELRMAELFREVSNYYIRDYIKQTNGPMTQSWPNDLPEL